VAGDDGTLTGIDPSGGPQRVVTVASRIHDIALAGGAVWVSAE
jgi:hypothetical protein